MIMKRVQHFSSLRGNVLRHIVYPPTVRHYSSSPPCTSPFSELSFIGAPMFLGQTKAGTELAPDTIRHSGLFDRLRKISHYSIIDRGNIGMSDINVNHAHLTDSFMKNKGVGVGNEAIFRTCFEAASSNDFVLTVGGDHSIAIGTVASALKRDPDICVVWVDAHADINTPSTSPTGNLHGMPVSVLMDIWNVRDKDGFTWLKSEGVPPLQPERIVYIGLRDVDPGEKELLSKYNIKAYYSDDVSKLGIKKVMEEVLQYFPPSLKSQNSSGVKNPIHLSFDIDALDPSHAPATGTPVHDGLSLDDGLHICSELRKSHRLISMDLVELNPKLGDTDGTAVSVESCVQLLESALGVR